MRQRDGEPAGTVAPGARRAPARSSSRRRVAPAALLVGASGFVRSLRPPAPQMVLVGLTIALLVAARLWTPLRSFVETVDLRALALFHVTRFVGFYFSPSTRVASCRGRSPCPAAGATTSRPAWVLVLVRSSGPTRGGGRVHYLAWNVFGLLDILGVVLTAARLAFREPASMRALLELPLSLLVTFVVPIIIATHVIMLGRLAGTAPARRSRP